MCKSDDELFLVSETRQFSEVLRDVEEKFSKLQECGNIYMYIYI